MRTKNITHALPYNENIPKRRHFQISKTARYIYSLGVVAREIAYIFSRMNDPIAVFVVGS